MANDPRTKKEQQKLLSNGSILKYPPNVDGPGIGKGVMFHIREYRKPGVIEKEQKTDRLQTIALPIPNDLTNSDDLEWENAEGGLVSRGQQIKNAWKNMDLTNAVGGVVEGGASALLSSIRAAGDEGAAGAAIAGATTNPRQLSAFNKVSFKSHSFSIKMVARSQRESEDIERIINTFRAFAHPSFAGGSKQMYKFPKMFDIEFFPTELNKHMFKPNTSALQSIEVAYNGEAPVIFFNDTNQPVEITLSMQFQELTVHTEESLKEQHGQAIGGG